MATVTALQYDSMTDTRPVRDGLKSVVFEPRKVQRASGKVWLGVAEVSEDIARAYYVGHPGFEVEGLECADALAEELFAGEAEAEVAEADAAGDDAPVEHRVEQSGAWYKLYGPDGQVGKSQRSEADAWALLDAE